MRDIIIDLLVECHNPCHRADRNLGVGQQTPDPKLPGIGMALLQVIHVDHQGQPHFPGWGLGRPALLLQAGPVLGLESLDAGIDRGTGDMQEPADADFLPALRVEFDHLPARLGAVRRGVIVLQRQGFLRDHRTLLPEPLGGLVVDAFAERIEDDPGEFARVKPCIERFEPGNLLHNRYGDAWGFLFWDDLDIVQHEPEHALLLKATPELAYRVRVRVGFLGPVRGRAIFKEHERTDEFIPPLQLIDKAKLQLRKVTGRFHAGVLHTGAPGAL